MFNSIWVKITAILSALLVAITYYAKMLTNKNKKLKDELEVKDKMDDIRAEEKEAKKEILKDEKKRINKRIKIKPTNTRRERINRMRNNQTRSQ